MIAARSMKALIPSFNGRLGVISGFIAISAIRRGTADEQAILAFKCFLRSTKANHHAG